MEHEPAVLVTGGAGFIGSNLARYLDQRGTKVILVDNLSTGLYSNLDGMSSKFIHCNLASQHDVIMLETLDFQCVVHLAAMPSVPKSLAAPAPSFHHNLGALINTLELARSRGAHVIVASSSSVYGTSTSLPKIESVVGEPLSPYAAYKASLEKIVQGYAIAFGLEALIFRFFNVYGPGQLPGHAYAAVIPAMLEAALTGKTMRINGDGTQTRDFTYIDSVVSVIDRSIRRRVSSLLPINLAAGCPTSLNELLALMSNIGIEVPYEYGPERPGDVKHSYADNSSLVSLFPDVNFEGLANGLQTTYSWMEEHLGARG